MKSTVRAVALLTLSLTLLAPLLAHAQPSNPLFQHVIIVIQENRTPDNLFGAYALQPNTGTLPQLGAGYDLSLPPTQPYGPNNQQEQVSWCLGTCFNPGHENSDWTGQYNGGMYNPTGNGVNKQVCQSGSATCGTPPQTVCIGQGCTQSGSCTPSTCIQMPTWGQETYTDPFYDAEAYYIYPNTTSPASPLIPLFDIANKYGFANYFFQTNQGPSEPAHDFLFGGTSAPTGDVPGAQTDYYQFFAGDNVDQTTSGCGTTDTVNLIFPNGKQKDSDFNGDQVIKLPPCFEHLTLADLLDTNGLTWRWYTPTSMGIWDAPAGIGHICEWNGTTCNSKYFTGNGPNTIPNVITPPEVFFADAFSPPGGTNINAPPPPGGGSGPVYCDLPNVTWIVPNGTWSDHPEGAVSTDRELGPDWVASIINAVGNATCTDPVTNGALWDDTVIFVVWDDWGGFYDHLGGELPSPFNNWNNSKLFPNFSFGRQFTGGPNGKYGQNGGCFFQPFPTYGGNWGCGYTYGWRVPFLVVSKWTPDGYVSGACTQGVNCPNPGPYNVHDFGSILAFIENNFLGQNGIGGINSASDNDGSGGYSGSGYLFADAYYPEGQVSGGPYLPLGDFFGLWWNSENSVCPQQNPNDGCPKSFEQITCVVPHTSPWYTYNGPADQFCPGYFTNYAGPIEDPDNDVIDND
ncbi:MAG: alkaline phosphatase family protein [Terriglobales bacterium]